MAPDGSNLVCPGELMVFTAPQATAKRRFMETIRDFYDKHHVLPVIVIDEGQELSTAMINELRFVINFDVDSTSPLAVFI